MSVEKAIRMNLNGETREFVISAGESLLDLLRRSGYSGTKRGCEDGACGSCTVILDGAAVNACITFAFQAHERERASAPALSPQRGLSDEALTIELDRPAQPDLVRSRLSRLDQAVMGAEIVDPVHDAGQVAAAVTDQAFQTATEFLGADFRCIGRADSRQPVGEYQPALDK